VSGFDERGEPVTYAGTGMLARCLQHEYDHLQGVVFGDRLATRQRKKLYKEAEKYAEEFPPGWPADD
jgi:peptide deformylase